MCRKCDYVRVCLGCHQLWHHFSNMLCNSFEYGGGQRTLFYRDCLCQVLNISNFMQQQCSSGACFYFLCVLPRVLSTLSRLRLFAILFLAASSDFKEARSEDLDLDLDATATLCLLVVWVLVCLWVLCCVCSERCLDKDLDRASFWARLLSGCSPLKELVVEVV